MDQLKGRESQVRIILNKADEITAEELLKIQGNLVWNVSPLMASMEPPTLYAGSFWSRPYKVSKTSDQNEILPMIFSGGCTQETAQGSGAGSAEGHQGRDRQKGGEQDFYCQAVCRPSEEPRQDGRLLPHNLPEQQGDVW